MKKWRYTPHNDGESSKFVDFLLVLGIAGGLGYLGYTHPEEIKSLEGLVGWSASEAPSSRTASSSSSSSLPAASTSTPMTSSSTNEVDNPPLIGRPRTALPAQDHWTWATTDGKVYQEVKVEKIQGDYVTIIHADGGARIPISTLPSDVQKELNAYSN